MGGAQLSREYQERLEAQIDYSYASCCKQNNAKNIFNAARTPAVFITLILFCYTFRYILGFVITIVFLERLLGFITFASFVMLAVWVYARWSGQLRDVAQIIDYISEFLWDQVHTRVVVLGFVIGYCLLARCSLRFMLGWQWVQSVIKWERSRKGNKWERSRKGNKWCQIYCF